MAPARCANTRVQVRTRARHFVLGAGSTSRSRRKMWRSLENMEKDAASCCVSSWRPHFSFPPALPSLPPPHYLPSVFPCSHSLFSPFLRPPPRPPTAPNTHSNLLMGVREAGIQILSSREGRISLLKLALLTSPERAGRGVPSRGGSPKCLQAPSA